MAATIIDHAIMQMFGIRAGRDFDESIHAMEGKAIAAGKLLVKTTSTDAKGVALTPAEARYFATKLTELADRVDSKAKARGPCEGCGR